MCPFKKIEFNIKTPIFLLFTFITLLTACNENRIFEKHTDPSGNLEWEKGQVIAFDVNIEDPALTYTITAALRYAQGIALSELPVEIRQIEPNGEVKTGTHVFHVRNSEGAYNGNGAGDIWDLEEVYAEGARFPEKGTYRFEMRQLSDRPKIHMVMEVGLIVDKVVSQP